MGAKDIDLPSLLWHDPYAKAMKKLAAQINRREYGPTCPRCHGPTVTNETTLIDECEVRCK